MSPVEPNAGWRACCQPLTSFIMPRRCMCPQTCRMQGQRVAHHERLPPLQLDPPRREAGLIRRAPSEDKCLCLNACDAGGAPPWQHIEAGPERRHCLGQGATRVGASASSAAAPALLARLHARARCAAFFFPCPAAGLFLAAGASVRCPRLSPCRSRRCRHPPPPLLAPRPRPALSSSPPDAARRAPWDPALSPLLSQLLSLPLLLP